MQSFGLCGIKQEDQGDKKWNNFIYDDERDESNRKLAVCIKDTIKSPHYYLGAKFLKIVFLYLWFGDFLKQPNIKQVKQHKTS